jgi:hypothetical protein
MKFYKRVQWKKSLVNGNAISYISRPFHYLSFQAALRKISANCGTKVIEDLDAMELVEPRLLDSFLIYSSRQESYV